MGRGVISHRSDRMICRDVMTQRTPGGHCKQTIPGLTAVGWMSCGKLFVA